MSEQEKGFTVKDRRRFDSSGETRGEQAEAEQQEAQPQEQSPSQGQAPEAASQADAGGGVGSGGGKGHQLPPVDFSGLIISLAQATMMHLGQIPGPDGQPMPPQFDLARHTIDTIAMLQQKTEGNLDPEEKKLIDEVVKELRMAFVHLAG